MRCKTGSISPDKLLGLPPCWRLFFLLSRFALYRPLYTERYNRYPFKFCISRERKTLTYSNLFDSHSVIHRSMKKKKKNENISSWFSPGRNWISSYISIDLLIENARVFYNFIRESREKKIANDFYKCRQVYTYFSANIL